MMSAIKAPRWSSVVECQSVECAFTSPVIMVLGREVMCARVLDMSVSSVAWFGSLVFRGGMYMLAT